MTHGLLRISCSRNPKTPKIRSFFYEKWLLFGVVRNCLSGIITQMGAYFIVIYPHFIV